MRSKMSAITMFAVGILAATQTLFAAEAQSARMTFMDGGCVISAKPVMSIKHGPQTVLTTACARVLRSFTLDEDVIQISANYPHQDRAYVLSVGGSHVRLTILHVAVDKQSASVVYDRELVYTPDIVNLPDVVLVYTGERYVNGEKLPTRTIILTWNGQQFVESKIQDWSMTMGWKDRFMVLQ